MKTDRIYIRTPKRLAAAVREAAKREDKNAGEFTRIMWEQHEAVQAILTKQPKTKGTK
jgi:hypothetical protein